MVKRIFSFLPELAALALAAALRAPGLGEATLTASETRIWMFAGDSWGHLLRLFRLAADPNTGTFFPYVWFLKLWLRWGDSEAWLRLPSLLAGMIAVVMVYFFARRVFGRWAGVIAAILFAAAPYNVAASRTVSATSIGVALFVIGLYLFYLIFEGDRRPVIIASFAAVTLVGVNFGFHAALLILPMNVLFFGFAKDRMKSIWWWIPLNLALIGCALYWEPRWAATFFVKPPTWESARNQSIYGFIPKESIAYLQLRLLFIEKYFKILFTLGGFYFNSLLVNGWSFLGVIILVVSYHYFPFLGFREYEGGYRPRVFAFITLALTLALAGLFSMTQLQLWEVLLPAAAVLYAVAAHGAVKHTGWRGKTLLALMILSMVLGFVPMQRAEEKSRPDWREAAAFLESDPERLSPIVLIDGGEDTLPLFYYGRPFLSRLVSLMPDIDLKIIGKDKFRQDEFLPVIKGTVDTRPPEGIMNLFKLYPRVWIVKKGAGLPEKPRWAREYAIWLQKFAVVVKEKKIEGGLRIENRRAKDKPADDKQIDGDIYLQLYELRGLNPN
ncbi:MAG: glycosyltransferase family 39 protein [bacterium]